MLNGLVSTTWSYKGTSYDGRLEQEGPISYWVHFRKDMRKKDAEQLPFSSLDRAWKFLRELKPKYYGISHGLSWIVNRLTI